MSSFRQLMMRDKGGGVEFGGLCFTAEEANSTLTITKGGSPKYSLKYSTDGVNWTLFADSTQGILDTITFSGVGNKVYIKGVYKSQGYSSVIAFSMTGKFSVSGNIHSILDEDNFETITDLTLYPEDTFRNLFNGDYNGMGKTNCLVSIENLLLPATKLNRRSYYQMFGNNVLITKAPFLPNFTVLPDSQGGAKCLSNMFFGCSSLNYLKTEYTGNFGSRDFSSWLYGVSATGDFYYNGSETNRGDSYIPTNWTVHTF